MVLKTRMIRNGSYMAKSSDRTRKLKSAQKDRAENNNNRTTTVLIIRSLVLKNGSIDSGEQQMQAQIWLHHDSGRPTQRKVPTCNHMHEWIQQQCHRGMPSNIFLTVGYWETDGADLKKKEPGGTVNLSWQSMETAIDFEMFRKTIVIWVLLTSSWHLL